MEDARIKVLIVAQDMPDVELNNFDQVQHLTFEIEKYGSTTFFPKAFSRILQVVSLDGCH